MARLRRPVDATVRSLQMSRAKLHIYIEGHSPDIYVYEKVAQSVCGNKNNTWDFRIITPRELPQDFSGEGKTCLIKWFQYLRRRKLLEIGLTRKSALVFTLDKDVDDIRKDAAQVSSYYLYRRL